MRHLHVKMLLWFAFQIVIICLFFATVTVRAPSFYVSTSNEKVTNSQPLLQEPLQANEPIISLAQYITSDKTAQADPNQPSYDTWENYWSADGNLIHAACPNSLVDGKDNPQCVCPAPTSAGTYYLQGYDSGTNAVICAFAYNNPCPYANNVSGDDPVCHKFEKQ